MKKTKPSGPWRPFENISHKDRYWSAVRKLGKNFMALRALNLLCYWIYETGTWSYDDGLKIVLVCLPILVYLDIRFFWRFILEGFFACYACRRLKTAPHFSMINVCHNGDCQSCADFEGHLQERAIPHVAGGKKPFASGDPTCRRVAPVEFRKASSAAHRV